MHWLRVVEKRRESNDAVSLVLEVPESKRMEFRYKPGQFLTLAFQRDGKELRRAYSLVSSPVADQNLQVTVKRIPGGVVSGLIHDDLNVGDSVSVLPPAGRFCIDVAANHYKTYYLFGAGSGITPLFSILRSVLLAEEKSHVHLLLGNRSEDTIIFREAISELHSRFGDRLKVVHSLSQPNREQWSAIWKWDGIDWKARKGRIDEAGIRWFFREHPPVAQDAQYFICGPGTMIESVEQALKRIGVPAERIHTERFSGTRKSTSKSESVVDAAVVSGMLEGESFRVTLNEEATVLRGLLDAGVGVPYSCESGVCGTCRARLKSGTVQMESWAALSDKELESGEILTCQAKPTTREIEIEFES